MSCVIEAMASSSSPLSLLIESTTTDNTRSPGTPRLELLHTITRYLQRQPRLVLEAQIAQWGLAQIQQVWNYAWLWGNFVGLPYSVDTLLIVLVLQLYQPRTRLGVDEDNCATILRCDGTRFNNSRCYTSSTHYTRDHYCYCSCGPCRSWDLGSVQFYQK